MEQSSEKLFNTSPYTLKILAALVWYGGVIILFLKSADLLLEAFQINSNLLWIVLTILSGLIIGTIKAIFLFKPICIKNIKRIDHLEQPKIWNFYRPQFFIFLFFMVSLGAFLSYVAHGDYILLLIVVLIDITIATALLVSSWNFWK